MGEDYDAQWEAWTRRKPKRIIHNQLVIMLLLASSVSVSGIMMWLVGLAILAFPPTVMVILVSWGIMTISYGAFLLAREKANSKD